MTTGKLIPKVKVYNKIILNAGYSESISSKMVVET